MYPGRIMFCFLWRLERDGAEVPWVQPQLAADCAGVCSRNCPGMPAGKKQDQVSMHDPHHHLSALAPSPSLPFIPARALDCNLGLALRELQRGWEYRLSAHQHPPLALPERRGGLAPSTVLNRLLQLRISFTGWGGSCQKCVRRAVDRGLA